MGHVTVAPHVRRLVAAVAGASVLCGGVAFTARAATSDPTPSPAALLAEARRTTAAWIETQRALPCADVLTCRRTTVFVGAWSADAGAVGHTLLGVWTRAAAERRFDPADRSIVLAALAEVAAGRMLLLEADRTGVDVDVAEIRRTAEAQAEAISRLPAAKRSEMAALGVPTTVAELTSDRAISGYRSALRSERVAATVAGTGTTDEKYARLRAWFAERFAAAAVTVKGTAAVAPADLAAAYRA